MAKTDEGGFYEVWIFRILRCSVSGQGQNNLEKCGCIVPNEPKINDYNMTRLFKCKHCEHVSVTKKGLRFHLLMVHKRGRLFHRTLDAYGRPLNFFGDLPVEMGKEEPPKQLQTEDIEEGDEEFKRGMSIAIRESIVEAAAKGYFDSDED
ncbi:hypothetical protein CEXT_623751 [Caerostris extrusa]|uniref:C2H2-type domain-containing protein n=1 Tax=Caerostris extrusa TaxID=172846 RepID=A0AAV4Y324_CAEEX|nr:hypothetical protein CEXT_623751 [Caerostris extrusa]